MNASEREEESNVQRCDGKIGRLRKLMEAKRKRAETKSISLETDKLTLPKPDVSPSDERPAFDSILSEAIAVTDKPVDRIALANNLFASGELALAQKIYESIDLNEVTEGGGTHFVNLGVNVEPKQGVLMVWNNAKPDGSPNEDTLHAGTPVLQGTKYVITKWYRTRRWK